LLSAFVVGPELERAQVVLCRAVPPTVERSLGLPAPCGATDGFL
jgi:hypothetical protein